MDDTVSLPHKDRFFELRFESIGGLGAHAAGQILATAAVLRMGLNGAHFSSYGSEKKGSLIKSFIRLGAADQPIRTSAPVESPDVVVVFHGALLSHPATVAGLRANGTLIFTGPPGEIPDGLARLPRTATVIRIDAQRIAAEEKSRPNAVLTGTLAEAVALFDTDTLLQALSDEFARKRPEAVASNEAAFRRGTAEFEILPDVGRVEDDLPIIRPDPFWGYQTAPPGGIILNTGSTAWNDLTTSRTGWLPVLDIEKCIHCGMCDMACPDLCLVWTAEGNQPVPTAVKLSGIDYRYCKGCMRCIETCPTGAMTREAETPGLVAQLNKPLFPQLVD
ncbi:MAG: 2-oxoacid:acceptor oxidoreductase family protein [Rhodospirillales bacterium]|jgi:pyruvate ferredoxin oxidoreductase gamma subunit|nr:2-oxoacid:acceptor oxidoreductase family protein [Rhodospirillales bacterium]MDP6774864.1 2-oxoacid:acceptor oxidoreductase family protein [Rhodospirillales bacterium]